MAKSSTDEYRLEQIDRRLTALEDRATKQDSTINEVKLSVGKIEQSLAIAKSFFVYSVPVTGILVTLLIAGFNYFTSGTKEQHEAYIESIARKVAREEMSYRSTIIQQGRFSAKNRLPNEPTAFRWSLNVPVEPSKVATLQVEPLEPLPGIAFTAELSDDGKSCVMRLHGPTETLSQLPDVVNAKLTISLLR